MDFVGELGMEGLSPGIFGSVCVMFGVRREWVAGWGGIYKVRRLSLIRAMLH